MVDQLNDEQRQAVAHDDHLCLMSCPGSGKTRVIVAKMLASVDQVRGTARKIGCITYTNAAVEEIESRLRRKGTMADESHCDVGTIHSFCLNNIVRPHQHCVPAIQDGFKILSPEDAWYQETTKEIMTRYSLPDRMADSFGQIQREPDGSLFLPDGLPEPAAAEFLARVQGAGYMTMSDIVFYAFTLMKEQAYVARGLGSRFAWLLVDEFQDTSSCQSEILKLLYEQGRTKLYLVGDVNQSIYSFAGARPTLMEEVARHVGARMDVKLVGNYRCSEKIVKCAERLCPGEPPMRAAGVTRGEPQEPRLIQTSSALEAVWEHFIPTLDELSIPLGNAAVLAPQWFTLLPLARALRDREVPVYGPGARPYRRSREFAQFAENLCAFVEEPSDGAATALQRSMFIMILNLTGIPDWRVYSYEGKKVLCEIAIQAKAWKDKWPGAVEWLGCVSGEVGALLKATGYVNASDAVRISGSGMDMVDDVRKTMKEEADNLATERLGLYARPKDCLHLLTMHRAKGREWDAVAVVDVHDDKVPHFSAKSTEKIAEARRLLYVATTRAKRFLLYATDSSHPRNTPSRFLGEDGVGLIS